MHLDNYCPGCGGGTGNQPCAIARCSQQRGGIEYCYLCDEYPCKKYEGIDEFDSFITHRNQLKDFEKVKNIGIDLYQSELAEKIEILKCLFANYNDGRRKSFFCIAVNLLELQDVRFDFISDRILSDVYLIVIVLFLIALLFHNNVYCNLQINCLNKKRNLIIVSALGLGFIVINDVISILMILCIRSAFLLGL